MHNHERQLYEKPVEMQHLCIEAPEGKMAGNVIEVEHALLNSLTFFLGDADVKRDSFGTIYSFPMTDNRRVNIRISVDDVVLCEECNTEILFPGYQQTTHKAYGSGSCPVKQTEGNDNDVD